MRRTMRIMMLMIKMVLMLSDTDNWNGTDADDWNDSGGDVRL